MSWRWPVANVLPCCGAGVELIAVVGMCAARDAYDRLHYVGLAGFGALLVAVAIVVRESFSLIGDNALLVGVILVATGSVLAQSTVRSLLIRERGDWRRRLDDAEETPRA